MAQRGTSTLARWSREPGARERESEEESGSRGGRHHWIFYSFLGDDFSKLRNYHIVSDGDNTQVQLETIPPFPPLGEEG